MAPFSMTMIISSPSMYQSLRNEQALNGDLVQTVLGKSNADAWPGVSMATMRASPKLLRASARILNLLLLLGLPSS
jgi:hypothetical protein